MPLDLTNPATLRFFTENIEKENLRRMLWFLKNKEKLIKKNTIRENSKEIRVEDVQRAAIQNCISSFKNDYHENKVHHRKKHINVSTWKLKDINEEPIMNPVEESVKNILYKDLPHGGRREYLKARNLKPPEDKYNCETSSSVIGWKLKESYISRQGPKYGRFPKFTRDEMSHTGPQPDPSYYQTPLGESYSKCYAS